MLFSSASVGPGANVPTLAPGIDIVASSVLRERPFVAGRGLKRERAIRPRCFPSMPQNLRPCLLLDHRNPRKPKPHPCCVRRSGRTSDRLMLSPSAGYLHEPAVPATSRLWRAIGAVVAYCSHRSWRCNPQLCWFRLRRSVRAILATTWGPFLLRVRGLTLFRGRLVHNFVGVACNLLQIFCTRGVLRF